MIRRFFAIAVAVSLLLHLCLGTAIWFTKKSEKKDSVIEVTIQSPVSEQEPKRQIVDQSKKRLNDEVDPQAKYLSRFDQRVERETRAKTVGRFQNQAGQGPLKKGGQDGKPKAAKADRQTAPDGLPTLEALKPKLVGAKQKTQETAGVENPGPISQTVDYLKDVEEGVQTLLSTREFVYYSYYHRIKERLHQYWEPKIRDKFYKLYRQGRKIASTRDRITKVRITLNQKGVLIGVAVVSESGMEELDDAAVEAFREAAPFPNPPKGIVGADGTIKIDWSFVLLEA